MNQSIKHIQRLKQRDCEQQSDYRNRNKAKKEEKHSIKGIQFDDTNNYFAT